MKATHHAPSDSAGLAFTGERPGRGAAFAYDEARHLAAYRFAAGLVAGKRVLDAGCGDGLGTRFLARVAREVVGVDASARAIAACRATWRVGNLRFEQGDVATDAIPGGTYEVVVCLQLLEHLREPRGLLARLRQALDPGGMLVLSTPNRLRSVSENPFHVHEYTAPELAYLLKGSFSRVSLLGVHGNAKVEEYERRRAAEVRRLLALDPLRLRRALPAAVVRWAFARLAVVVRRRVRHEARENSDITAEDFDVSADRLDEALDLVALCSA